MIVFSDEQLAMLARTARQRSYSDVAEAFSTLEPRIFAPLTEDERLGFIEACHLNAQRFGFDTMAGLYLLTDVSILLGTEFWRDPLFQNITAELNQRSIHGDELATRRTRKWLSTTLPHLRGARCEILSRALKVFCAIHANGRSNPVYSSHEHPSASAIALLNQINPTVIKLYGSGLISARTDTIITHAKNHYRIRDSSALATFNMMSVFFGIGFDTDPLYPWISAELARADSIGGEAALSKVVSRVIPWFEAAIEEIDVNGIN